MTDSALGKPAGGARDEGDSSQQNVAEIVQRLESLWSREENRNIWPSASGQQIGNFRIIRPLGFGGFGVVYLARDDDLHRDIALKIPRPEVLLDPAQRSRFHDEAATAAALDHPNIVKVFEAEFDSPVPYIVVQYIAGPDLGKWLAARKAPPSIHDAARFLAILADAVHYAHGRGVMHRDLKPTNILLARPTSNDESPARGLTGYEELSDVEPMITDFGLAKLAESSLQDTRSSLIVGTPLYMAPE